MNINKGPVLKPKELISKLQINEIGVRSDLKFQIKNLIDRIIFISYIKNMRQ